LVNADVAILPGIIDLGVYIRGIGRVPHVVLEEPKKRIA